MYKTKHAGREIFDKAQGLFLLSTQKVVCKLNGSKKRIPSPKFSLHDERPGVYKRTEKLEIEFASERADKKRDSLSHRDIAVNLQNPN